MAFIPEDKLLEIKDAASIEEVVGQYVKLTQKGRNLSGLCPFHSETKPSFTVAPEKGIFHCFGCGVGGNVFSFLMHYHRLSFPEAVQELARRYGIPVSLKDLGPEGAQQATKRTKAYEANTAAAAFYAATLASSEGRPGREYLKKRGLTPEIIRAFQLGYAVDEWDALRRHFQHRGISLELGQEVGLLAPRDRGGFYDRFRHRIIFPIFDRQSRVIAFGGRTIGDGEPKYLNSPESLLYSKGLTLYGLPQAAEALRATRVALVVEGYELEAERTRLVNEAKSAALARIKEAETEFKAIVRRLQRGREPWGKLRQEFSGRQAQLLADLAPEPAPAPAPRFLPGQQVFLPALGLTGKVVAADIQGGRLEVQARNVNLRVSPGEVTPVGGEAGKAIRGGTASGYHRAPAWLPSLNLVGLRVDEALPLVDRLIDQAVLHGQEKVDIIHGVGTGRLKRALWDHLKHHGLVKELHADANPGVTVVDLKE